MTDETFGFFKHHANASWDWVTPSLSATGLVPSIFLSFHWDVLAYLEFSSAINHLYPTVVSV